MKRNPPPLAGISRLCRLAEIGRPYSSWYNVALAESVWVCELENWPVKRFIDILAITSPRVAIRRNVRLALQYCRSRRVFTSTMKQTTQSLKTYEATGEISKRGLKITAFRNALLGDRSAIVLDVWIARALKVDQLYFSTKVGYAHASQRMLQASKRFKMHPRDFQACVWAGIFRELSTKQPQFFPILAEHHNWLAYDRQFPDSGPIIVKSPAKTFV